jgi:hypothetical protein
MNSLVLVKTDFSIAYYLMDGSLFVVLCITFFLVRTFFSFGMLPFREKEHTVL